MILVFMALWLVWKTWATCQIIRCINVTLYTLKSVHASSLWFLYVSSGTYEDTFFLLKRSFWVCSHFVHSHELNVWFRGDIVGRNLMLITLWGWRVKPNQTWVVMSFTLENVVCFDLTSFSIVLWFLCFDFAIPSQNVFNLISITVGV